MEVEIISLYYQDEFLIPFYMRHYAWADKITLITKTLSSGINNEAQAAWYTEAYQNSKADWVIVCDIDEFVFVARETLQDIPSGITVKEASLYDIYPHWEESVTLDPKIPVKDQRRHGFLLDPFYIKPIILRGGLNITLGVGRHGLSGSGVKIGPRDIIGAHWRNCSLQYALDTRLKKRKDRFCKEDIEKGYSLRDRLETEESIRSEFAGCRDYPLVF